MVEENVAKAHRWFEEVWNQKREESVWEILAPDCVLRGISEDGSDLHGPGAFVEFMRRQLASFPGMRMKLEDCFGAGDKIVARWSATMAHDGESFGFPATGAQLTLHGMSVSRFVNGRLAESWDIWDQAGLVRQLQSNHAKGAGA